MKKIKKPSNKYDNFIDKMIQEFIKIPNFNLSYEDEMGKKIFNFSTKRMAEISSYQTLFLHYYLKSASKAVVEDLKEIRTSKYKNFLLINKEDLKENYYETIRLGYVGLFHKYENYMDELIEMSELLIQDFETEDSISLVEYSKREFDFRIKDWKFSNLIEYINWIAICIKHYDGYPRKKPRPTIFSFNFLYPENKKLKLTKEDFKRDSQLLIQFYPLIMQLVFSIAMHKMAFESNDYEKYRLTSPELYQKMIKGKEEATLQIRNVIKLFKKEQKQVVKN